MKRIKLTKRKYAMISDSDFEEVSKFKWRAVRITGSNKTGKVYEYGYKAGRRENNKMIWMHNFIRKPGPGLEVDHKDGDPLNNTRSNLRTCTHANNCVNRGLRSNKKTSQYLGVCKRNDDTRFTASIYDRIKKEVVTIGMFRSEKAAAKAHDVAAKKLYGSFARLNFKD